jgi:hypothetical protein
MSAHPTPTPAAPRFPSGLGLHEYDAICQRCGRRAGSRMAIDADAPADGFFRVVCDRCTAGDAREAA